MISSFSGGRTSAYMTYLLKKENPDLKVVFMNTGLEHEKTLEFVNACDKAWDLNIDWIEAVVHHKKRVATTHRYVDFKTACRNIYIAEQVVLKYGLFGMGYLHCTREMKLRPFKSWVKENKLLDSKIAIGIRSDEMDRVDPDYEKKNLFYPLLSKSITKDDVNRFWDNQEFNLELEDYLGNCKACWKKTKSKLDRIAKEHPEFISELTPLEKIGTKGSDKMFRSKKDTTELLDLGCKESCEVF